MLILASATAGDGYCQPPAPPKDIAGFFFGLVGEWIGTVEQYTGGVKATTKYFHAVIKQTSPDTYAATFEYYRLDKTTHAPVQVGVTIMTNKITPEGTVTNTITGKGDIFINPTTEKPEEHQLSEVLRMSPSGSLEGNGSGKISISGLALGAGKNGKVSNYTSSWVLDTESLKITERLRVAFHVLFFAQHYDVIDDFEAKRGSDIVGLMKRAGEALEGSK
jgi:hypothetical protein